MIDKPNENVQQEDAEQELAQQAEQKLSESEQQVKEYSDRILRLQADMENMKRRAEKDIANAHKYATEKLLKELIAVVDSLEMGLQSQPTDETKPMIEGIKLTYKLFLDILTKHGVEPINPEGGAFNPELHQAVSMQPNSNIDPNTVLQVMQKGYSLNGRLIRPAMVVVSQ